MSDHIYTYGVEEEFFLSQPDNGAIATRMPQAFLHEVRRRLGERASNELLQSQIEMVTPILIWACEAKGSRNMASAALRSSFLVMVWIQLRKVSGTLM